MYRAKKSRISPAGYPSKHFPIGDNQRFIAPNPTSNVIFSRFVRAPSTGDKFADFVSHMELIARIANGISLQTGLIEASIPVDDVIAELLHMGSMKPNQLISLNQADMTDVMDMLKNAPAQLKASDEVKEIENLYVKMNTVIKSNFDFQAYKNLTGKAEYEASLKELTDSKVIGNVTTVIKRVISVAESLALGLRNVKQMESDSDTQQSGVEKIKLETINADIIEVGKKVENLQPAYEMLKSLKELDQKSSFVRIFFDEFNARNNFVSIAQDPKAENDLAAIIKHFDAMGALFGKHQQMLSNLNSFADSLQSGRQTQVQYTAGLPNGLKDIDLLPADINDKWFQSSANLNQQTSRYLRKGLLPLEGFKMNLKSVESAWQPALSKVDKASDVFSQQLSIATQAKNAATRTTKISAFQNCQQSHAKKKDVTINSIDPVIQLMKNFTDKVRTSGDFEFVSKLAGLDAIKTAVQFKGTSDSEKLKETSAIVKKLKAMPGVAEAQIQMQNVFNEATALKYFVGNLTLEVQKIQKVMSSIDTYHTDTLNTNFPEWSDCLKKDVGNGGEVVAEVIESIRKVREMGTTQDIADAIAFTSAILKSTSAIKSAKSSAESMKSVMEVESKSLNIFKSSKADSLSLGLAARGIAEIKKVDDSRGKLKALTGDISFVQSAADNAKNNLARDEYKTLQGLAPLQKSLMAMYTEIDAFKSSVNKLVGTDLKSSKPVLAAAAKIKNVKVDAKKLKKAVAALTKADPTLQQQLSNVTASLDTLEDLDLQFSSFKMGGANGAIDNLDLFFTNWAKPASNNGGITTATDGSSFGVILLVIGGILLVIIACAGAVYGVYRCKRSSKKKEEVKLDNKKSSDSEKDKELEEKNKKIDQLQADADKRRAEEKREKLQKNKNEPVADNEKGDKTKSLEAKVDEKDKELDEKNKKIDELQADANQRKLDEEKRKAEEEREQLRKKSRLFITSQNTSELLEKYSNVHRKKSSYHFLAETLANLDNVDDQKKMNDDRKYQKQRRCSGVARQLATAVTLEGTENGEPLFVDANFTMMAGKTEWIMSQAPLDGTEKGKVSTLREHWMMIDSRRVKAIAQLCNFEETDEGATVKKCSHYYPEEVGGEMTCGDYRLKTLQKIDIGDLFTVEKEHISILRVEYTNIDVAHTVDILRYFNWPDHSAPTSVQVSLEIIRFLDSYKSTVLVHCSAGIGRTGTLVGIKKGTDMCEAGDAPTISNIVSTIRESRATAVKTPVQLMYMIVGITKNLIMRNNPEEFIPSYPSQLFYFERVLSGKCNEKDINSDQYNKDKNEREAYVKAMKAKWEAAHPELAQKAKEAEAKKAASKPSKEAGESKVTKTSTASKGSEA